MRSTVFVLLMIVLSAPGLFAGYPASETDIQKAQMFMARRMYPQAIALWQKVIGTDLESAQTNFQLGICYVNLHDFEQADASFAEAIRLELDYAYKIDAEYRKLACKAHLDGNPSLADAAHEKAAQYQPELDTDLDTLCEKEITENNTQQMIDEQEERKRLESLKAKLMELRTKQEQLEQLKKDQTELKKAREAIDIYRVEIAYAVHKNWAFPDELTGSRLDLQTLIIFKVMPDGSIKDLMLTNRSGDSTFDESA